MTAVRQCGPHNQIERPIANDLGTLRPGTSPTTGLQGKGVGGLDSLTTEQRAIALDLTQFGIDIVGMFEPTPFADGTNALISIVRGDWFGASLSGVSIVPYIGDLAKAGKLPRYAESIRKAIQMAKRDANFARYLGPALIKIKNLLDVVPRSKLSESVVPILEGFKQSIDSFVLSSKSTIHEITLTGEQYKAALTHVFPAQYLNPILRGVEGIGQRAAEHIVKNQEFLNACKNRNWKLAGTLFHSAANKEANAMAKDSLPKGWSLKGERTLQSGKGGSRADILVQGPNNEIIEIDWKTTGLSALSSKDQMTRHAGHISMNLEGSLTSQQSKSWMDFVRPLLPNMPWP